MNKVIDVANWFLSKDSMIHKKLQKLCYYAQAWHCALYDGDPLFEEEIQAWIHGPVIPVLYSCFSKYGWLEITKTEPNDFLFTEKSLEILESVYNTYGDLSGNQLEDLTHSEEPWIQARGDLQPDEISTAVISISSMQKYYLKQYEQAQND